MTLTPEQEAAIFADQQRANAEAIVKGARENPMQPQRSQLKVNGNRTLDELMDWNTSAPRIRRATDVAAALPHSAWLLRPYLERDAIAILYGDYGTYKSFVVLDWALRSSLGMSALGYSWPANRTPVVLISAEGRALPQRLRAWCIHNFPGEPFQSVLSRASLYCVEHPVNLSDPQSARALVAAIDALKITPGLVSIDTMSRNSDGRIEESTTTANAYLTTIDQGVRSRYGCAVVMTHHVGHTDKGRMRGPIVLAANTGALIRIERPAKTQQVATLTIDRLKDSDPPPPRGLRACVVDLGETDTDGELITSLALEATDAIPALAVTAKPELRGKAQKQLLAALREQSNDSRVWTQSEMREVGRALDLHKNTARDAAKALADSEHMEQIGNGWKLRNA